MNENDVLNLVEHRQWLLLAGMLIMALVTFARTFVARAGWTGPKDKTVSVIGSYLQDLSVMLPVFGYDLWPWAFLAALRGVLMSGGLAELLALISEKRPSPPPGPIQSSTDRVTPKETSVPSRPGAYSSLGFAVVVALVVVLAGCGAGPLVQDPRPDDGVEPCEVESAIVDGLGAALDDVEAVLPTDTPKATDGIGYARGVVEEGRAAVAACRALTEEHGSGLTAVIPWLTAAASVVRGIISILTAAHVDLPESIMGILRSLGLAQATLPQIEREAPWDVAVAR